MEKLVILIVILFVLINGILINNDLSSNRAKTQASKLSQTDVVYQIENVRVHQFWHKINGGDVACYLATDSNSNAVGIDCLSSF
jgi:hypothetical protein